jgi:hypothetical protein
MVHRRWPWTMHNVYDPLQFPASEQSLTTDDFFSVLSHVPKFCTDKARKWSYILWWQDRVRFLVSEFAGRVNILFPFAFLGTCWKPGDDGVLWLTTDWIVNALPEYNHSRWSLGGLFFLMPLINNSPDNLSFFNMRAEDSGVQNSGNRGKAEKFGRRIRRDLEPPPRCPFTPPWWIFCLQIFFASISVTTQWQLCLGAIAWSFQNILPSHHPSVKFASWGIINVFLGCAHPPCRNTVLFHSIRTGVLRVTPSFEFWNSNGRVEGHYAERNSNRGEMSLGWTGRSRIEWQGLQVLVLRALPRFTFNIDTWLIEVRI